MKLSYFIELGKPIAVVIIMITLLIVGMSARANPLDILLSGNDNAPYTVSGGTVYITSEIVDASSYQGLYTALDTCTTGQTLAFIITSPGGSDDAMYALSNAMQASKCTVDIKIRGNAASAAAVLAISGDTLTMEPGSYLMFHNGSFQISGSTSVILAALQAHSAVYKSFLGKLAKDVLTLEQLEAVDRGEDVYITYDQFVDKFGTNKVKFNHGKQ